MMNCKALGCGELIENEATYCNQHNAVISEKVQEQRQSEANALRACGSYQKYGKVLGISEVVCIKCTKQKATVLHYPFGRIRRGFSLNYLLPYCHSCHALAHE